MTLRSLRCSFLVCMAGIDTTPAEPKTETTVKKTWGQK